MWSLRNKDGKTYLTWDRYRWVNNNYRGIWELLGPKHKIETEHLANINRQAGYLVCDDDEGGIRALIFAEEKMNYE